MIRGGGEGVGLTPATVFAFFGLGLPLSLRSFILLGVSSIEHGCSGCVPAAKCSRTMASTCCWIVSVARRASSTPMPLAILCLSSLPVSCLHTKRVMLAREAVPGVLYWELASQSICLQTVVTLERSTPPSPLGTIHPPFWLVRGPCRRARQCAANNEEQFKGAFALATKRILPRG